MTIKNRNCGDCAAELGKCRGVPTCDRFGIRSLMKILGEPKAHVERGVGLVAGALFGRDGVLCVKTIGEDQRPRKRYHWSFERHNANPKSPSRIKRTP